MAIGAWNSPPKATSRCSRTSALAGFLTSMHDVAPTAAGGHRVAIFNPGGNTRPSEACCGSSTRASPTRKRPCGGWTTPGAASGEAVLTIPARGARAPFRRGVGRGRRASGRGLGHRPRQVAADGRFSRFHRRDESAGKPHPAPDQPIDRRRSRERHRRRDLSRHVRRQCFRAHSAAALCELPCGGRPLRGTRLVFVRGHGRRPHGDQPGRVRESA